MAGEIRIPVGLNTDTAIKDAEKLGKEVKRTLANIDMSKADSKTLTYAKNLNTALNRMEKLRLEAQKLADTKLPTDEYVKITRELEKAYNAVARLENREVELKDSKKILETRKQALLKSIKEQEALIEKLDSERHGPKQADSAYSEEINMLNIKSAEARDHLKELNAEYDKVVKSMTVAEGRQEKLNVQLENARRMEREYARDKALLEEENQAFISGKDTQAYKDKTAALNTQNQYAYILMTRWQETHEASEAATSDVKTETDAINKKTEALKHEKQAVDELDKSEKRSQSKEPVRGPRLKAGPSIQSVAFLNQGEVIRDTAEVNRELSKTSNTMARTRRQGSLLASMLTKVGSAFKSLGHHNKENNTQHINFGKTLKKSLNLILRYGLGIRGLFMLFRKLRGYVQEAFKVMAQEIPEVNDSISRLGTAFKQLKASFGTAFQPLLQVIEPILTRIIQRLAELMNQIARLFASLTGQNYIYEATVANYDYAKSVEAAEKANNGALASFDKLNVISKDTTKNTLALDKDTVKYNKVDIDPINLKSTKLYKSLEKVLSLIKTIGSTFKSVWDSGPGQEAIGHIKGAFEGLIGTVNNLAGSLETAWNKNEVGKSITEKLFGIFNNIWGTIEECSQATSEWAANLDFYPLLESIDGILGEISGILAPILDMIKDLYINYLLPMGKWFVEKLAPTLGNLIEKYLKVIKRIIDWLKPKLQWIMDNVIKPIGEKVGEAFLKICESIGDILDVIYENCDAIFKKLDDWLWPLVKNIASFLRDVFLNVISLVQGAVEGLLQIIKNLIPDLSGAFNGILDFITGVFTADWEKAWNGVKNAFLSIFNGVATVLEGIINFFIKCLNAISFDVPDWVPILGGSHVGFDIKEVHLERWEVPKLAQGAVLPPNQPFLAMVGDQKQGTNIEAPLDTIKQAVAEVLSSINIKNTFDVKGDPNGIFKVVQHKSEVFYNQYGYSPFGGQA